MKNHTSQELTKLLGKINEKLDDMQKSQNGIVTHLKNRCIQERRLDKDLFQYPIDVHIFNHEFMNVNKNMSLLINTLEQKMQINLFSLNAVLLRVSHKQELETISLLILRFLN